MVDNISDEIPNISRPQKIMVVGCEKFSARIINHLSKDGHVLKVVEQSSDRFNFLPQEKIDSNSISTVLGDYTDRNFWNQIKLNDIDIFIAATEIDSCNLFLYHLATHILKVPKVFVILKDGKLANIYQTFDMKIINISELVVNSIDNYINHDEDI